MSTNKSADDTNRSALLEQALIEEYLREQGYSLKTLETLPKDLAEKLMKDASQHASLKLEEVAARARFIEELREDGSSLK